MSLGMPDAQVLVTGGAGFIGRHLLRRLSKGHDRAVCGDIKPLPPQGASNVKYAKLDITDLDQVNGVVKGMDAIIHLASGNFATSLKDPVLDYRTGIEGTLNVLEAARRNDVRRVIYASSYIVYGHVDEVPVNEDALCAPVSPYGVSKFAGENYCRIYSDTYGMRNVCLRFTNVYGPLQEGGYLVPSLVAKIRGGQAVDVFGDGKQTRDFIYVEDVVEAILRSEGVDSKHCAINVGSGIETSVLELVNTIARKIGKSPTVKFHLPREGEMRRFAADTSKMKELLHYSPRFGLQEGIRETVAYPGAA